MVVRTVAEEARNTACASAGHYDSTVNYTRGTCFGVGEIYELLCWAQEFFVKLMEKAFVCT